MEGIGKEAARGRTGSQGALRVPWSCPGLSHFTENIYRPFKKKLQLTHPTSPKVTTEALLLQLSGSSKSPLMTLATAGLRVCIPSFLILLEECLIYDILEVCKASH